MECGKKHKRASKPEYFHAIMPFSFNMVCAHNKNYSIQMTFSYWYPAKETLPPSQFVEKLKMKRLNWMINNYFLKFLEEYEYRDFPVEWRKYFDEEKYHLNEDSPQAKDENIKKYVSELIKGAFSWFLSNQEKEEKNRLHYLMESLQIVRWSFLIEECTLSKPVIHQKTVFSNQMNVHIKD